LGFWVLFFSNFNNFSSSYLIKQYISDFYPGSLHYIINLFLLFLPLVTLPLDQMILYPKAIFKGTAPKTNFSYKQIISVYLFVLGFIIFNIVNFISFGRGVFVWWKFLLKNFIILLFCISYINADYYYNIRRKMRDYNVIYILGNIIILIYKKLSFFSIKNKRNENFGLIIAFDNFIDRIAKVASQNIAISVIFISLFFYLILLLFTI
jgi:hypothetical protein